MVIDGRAIAKEILEEVQRAQKPAASAPLVRAVVVAPTPATRSYLKIKEKAAIQAGMKLEVAHLPDSASADDIVAAIQSPGADAVLVQLPLPAHLNEEYILSHIPVHVDADVLSLAARNAGMVLSPVADAVKEILMRSGEDPAGKDAVIVGEGKLVGAPVAAWLRQAGANVSTYTKETFDLPEARAALRAARIIVSGAGNPHLITPDMISDGAILIDAGTSEKRGVLVGDIDPMCAVKARIFTPVPGGVGPIAVACLFRNAATLSRLHAG